MHDDRAVNQPDLTGLVQLVETEPTKCDETGIEEFRELNDSTSEYAVHRARALFRPLPGDRDNVRIA